MDDTNNNDNRNQLNNNEEEQEFVEFILMEFKGASCLNIYKNMKQLTIINQRLCNLEV